jgi:hypothetical protein
MKNQIFILLFACFSLTMQAQETFTIGTIVNEYDLGAWAMKQHDEICAIMYPAVSEGKLIPLTDDNKPMKANGLKLFHTDAAVFIIVDPDDPTIGYDSILSTPLFEHFYAFTITPTHFKVQVEKNGKTAQFEKASVYKMLSKENLMYLDKYADKGLVLFNKIPSKSLDLMTSFNMKLYNESCKTESELFKTDSLLSRYSVEEKTQRSSEEIVTFISTDPNDPTIGMDTIYLQPLNMPDTSGSQGVFYFLKGEKPGFNLSIAAIASGYHPRFMSIAVSPLIPFGLLKYDKVQPIIKDEKMMMEECLRLCLQNKLAPHQNDYDAYIEAFKIRVK